MTPEQELDLLMQEPSADDHVIRFKMTFPDSPKVYTYAGLKVGGAWYITGVTKSGWTWPEFIDWLKSKSANIPTIERATEWETL
jgi:hypothetical protein